MRKSTVVARVAAVAGVCALSFSLVGCTPSSDARHAEFLANPTPDMQGLAVTRAEVSNRHATIYDTNLRKMNHELGKVFFLDRPMRGEYPIPY
jgi:hypothetical protein